MAKIQAAKRQWSEDHDKNSYKRRKSNEPNAYHNAPDHSIGRSSASVGSGHSALFSNRSYGGWEDRQSKWRRNEWESPRHLAYQRRNYGNNNYGSYDYGSSNNDFGSNNYGSADNNGGNNNWGSNDWSNNVGRAKKDWVAEWLPYSKFGDIIADRFVALKTPADRKFDGQIAEDERFYVEDFMLAQQSQGHEISLMINLAFTSKYYSWNRRQMADLGFGNTEWWHCPIMGRQVPKIGMVEKVCRRIKNALDKNPGKYVAIHCTHGVNRTAFFVIAYLLKHGVYDNIEDAKAHFEAQRGETMKRDYLLEGLEHLLPQLLPKA